MRRAIALFALTWSFACGKDDSQTGAPDPNKVFEQRSQTVSYADVMFATETPDLFRTTDRLPDLDVHAIVRSDSELYVGTASGLFHLKSDGTAFEAIDLGANVDVVDLAALDGGRVAVLLRRAHVQIADAAGTEADLLVQTATTGETVQAIAADGDELWVGTSAGLIAVDVPGGTKIDPFRGVDVRDLSVRSGTVYLATSDGVQRWDARTGTMLQPLHALADDNVFAVFADDAGTVYAGSDTGYAAIPGPVIKAGIDGLAEGGIRSIHAAGGRVIMGHGIGATVLGDNGAKKDHYHSERWIPGETVTAVWIEADGTRWIGTHSGLSRIGFTMTTLLAKAELNETFLDARHWRMDGFVDDDVRFDDAWDLSGAPHTGDKDNDGLWTEMQIGAWCLAYASTHDERYYQSANKAMKVMMMQFDIPAKTFMAAGKNPGFITRSLVRDDEGPVFDDKTTQMNWHREEFEGRTYYWKDDTSSDEYAGHYYGIPLFYDLCAKTEEEKEELRARIRTSTDYLIAGNYKLIDLDGEPTTFGRWDDLSAAADGPDSCTAMGYDLAKCVESYYGGGWLNSLEILGHLLAAWHMTGDQKYYDAYEQLYTEKKYGKMIRVHEDIFTLSNPGFANHSDHELATLAYYTFLRYEPNEDRRQKLIESILAFYEYERPERHPWEQGMIASAVDMDVDLAGAVQTLMEMPTDWREVAYDNSHRIDANREDLDRHQHEQFDRVFPYDEIRTMKWNGNPYAVSGGGDPRGVLSPTPYQIAYWTLRYHGAITGP